MVACVCCCSCRTLQLGGAVMTRAWLLSDVLLQGCTAGPVLPCAAAPLPAATCKASQWTTALPTHLQCPHWGSLAVCCIWLAAQRRFHWRGITSNNRAGLCCTRCWACNQPSSRNDIRLATHYSGCVSSAWAIADCWKPRAPPPRFELITKPLQAAPVLPLIMWLSCMC